MSESSRTKNSIRNIGANGVYQAILIVSGLIIPRIILNFYGSELNGLVASLSQFINGFKIVEAGLAGASILALYKPLAERDKKNINGILSAVRILYHQVGALFLLLVVGLAIFYPMFKPVEALDRPLMTLLVFALGGKSFIEFFAVSKYRVFLISSQKMWVVSLASAFSEFLGIGFVYVLSRFGCSLPVVYASLLLPILARAAIVLIYVKTTVSSICFDAEPLKDCLKKRRDVLYLQVLGMVRTAAPVVILTCFLDLKTVSVYSIYCMVLAGVSSILSVLTGALSPGFGDVIARREKLILQKATREFEVIFYGGVAFFYSVSAVMLTPFVKIYTSGIDDVNYVRPFFAFLIALDGFFYSLKTPHGMLVTAAGLYRETRVQTTIQAAMIVVCGIVLTPWFGLIGMTIAMLLSNVYRTIDLLFFIPRTLTHLPVRDSALRMLQSLATFAAIFVPCHLCRLAPGTPAEWVRDAVLVSLFAASVTILFNLAFQRELVFSIFRRIKLALGGAT